MKRYVSSGLVVLASLVILVAGISAKGSRRSSIGLSVDFVGLRLDTDGKPVLVCFLAQPEVVYRVHLENVKIVQTGFSPQPHLTGWISASLFLVSAQIDISPHDDLARWQRALEAEAPTTVWPMQRDGH